MSDLAMRISREYALLSKHAYEEGVVLHAARNVFDAEPVYRVKPLVWARKESPYVDTATPRPGTSYHVWTHGNGKHYAQGDENGFCSMNYAEFDTEAEAKAACQAHWTATLAECLERV